MTRTLIVATCVAMLAPAVARAGATEDFDEAGTGWTDTLFSDLIPSGDGTFVREALADGLGAPSTSPPLPINVGGDKEGRYFEASSAPTASYALTDNVPQNILEDATIDGYVAIGNPDGQGSTSVAFMLRASYTGTANAYVAILSHTGVLRLARVRNNILGSTDNYVTSETFAMHPTQENFRLSFQVAGTELAASLWRLEAVAGVIVQTPVDLRPEAGVQNTITASDDELPEGRAGFRFFARGDNSVFLDDVRISCNGCPADLDCSGAVDVGDILAILAAWGGTGGPEDLDGDGAVGLGDVLAVLGAWGACP